MQRCECNPGFFGPVCAVQTANQPIVFNQAAGFSLNYQIDQNDPQRIFFRMEVCRISMCAEASSLSSHTIMHAPFLLIRPQTFGWVS
jgi:hypothetical protein